jgi:hypothetical protein
MQRWTPRSAAFRAGALILIIGALVVLERLTESNVSRTELDDAWRARMLSASFGVVANGSPMERPTSIPVPFESGSLTDVYFSPQAIVISDMRERRFFGLWGLGGWSFTGGLLGRIVVGPSVLELFGRRTVHREPGFVLDPRTYHDPRQTASLDFFLVVRESEKGRAVVLRDWSIRTNHRPSMSRVGWRTTRRRATL